MNGRSSILLRTAVLLLASCFGGCAMAPVSVEMPVAKPPLVDRLPLAMGIHYPPATRDYFYEQYQHMLGIPGGTSEPAWRIDLGAASMRHFDRMFAAMFDKAVPVEANPTGLVRAAALDGVLVMAIDDYTGNCGYASLGSCGGSIEYRFVLIGRDGQEIASWEVDGRHGTGVASRATVQSAMREATARFLINFYGDERVQQWLARARRTSQGADRQAVQGEGGRS